MPLEHTGYMDNLPDGLVIGEDDKEIMADFLSVLHTKNVQPDVAHVAIEWYNKFAEEQQDAIADTDATHVQEFEDKMRQDWGPDYRANTNLAGALIEGAFGKEGKALFLSARDANGQRLMTIPEVADGLVDIARKWNPAAQLIAPGGDAVQTLNDELAEISKYRKEHRTDYFKDEKMQARERELIDIKQKQEAA